MDAKIYRVSVNVKTILDLLVEDIEKVFENESKVELCKCLLDGLGPNNLKEVILDYCGVKHVGDLKENNFNFYNMITHMFGECIWA